MTIFAMPVALTSTAAAGLVNIWLGIRIGQVRSAEKIWVGDGGNQRLIARMRAQLNFAEFVPLVLILIALIELAKGTQLWLSIVAAVFILGRVAHGFGMDGWRLGRGLGAMTTMLTTIGLAIYAVVIVAAG